MKELPRISKKFENIMWCFINRLTKKSASVDGRSGFSCFLSYWNEILRCSEQFTLTRELCNVFWFFLLTDSTCFYDLYSITEHIDFATQLQEPAMEPLCNPNLPASMHTLDHLQGVSSRASLHYSGESQLKEVCQSWRLSHENGHTMADSRHI